MIVDERFESDCAAEIAAQGGDAALAERSMDWLTATAPFKYCYHFRAFGLPVIQFPQDIVALQELIWSVRPALVIETGIARGGSLVMSAGMLALLDYCDAAAAGRLLDPSRPARARGGHRHRYPVPQPCRDHGASAGWPDRADRGIPASIPASWRGCEESSTPRPNRRR